MRPQAYLEHIRNIEAEPGLTPEARQRLLDSAKRQLLMALPKATQRIVFAEQLLRQGHPRELIASRLCARYGVHVSQAYRDLNAALDIPPSLSHGMRMDEPTINPNE
jgi:predicted DNA-binding transcriptional regulator YafY